MDCLQSSQRAFQAGASYLFCFYVLYKKGSMKYKTSSARISLRHKSHASQSSPSVSLWKELDGKPKSCPFLNLQSQARACFSSVLETLPSIVAFQVK